MNLYQFLILAPQNIFNMLFLHISNIDNLHKYKKIGACQNKLTRSKNLFRDYLYSSQLFTGTSAISSLQKARIKALAKRAFVIRGILWSIAARRIL